MLTQITNALIWIDNAWQIKTLLLKDRVIHDIISQPIASTEVATYDAKGMSIIPGGIDLHVHGAGGRDFSEATEEAFRTAMQTHLMHGTTTIYPTLAATSFDTIKKAVTVTEKLLKDDDTPIMGLHLEGPYLNPKMAGGQMMEYIKNPDPEEYLPILNNTECIKRWDASPELPGAMELGRALRDKRILAAVAHTEAEYDVIKEAYDNGYTHATHFYNAMTGFHKCREFKQEGTVESIYLLPEMSIELIADGIHVPPTLLRLATQVKGIDYTCLITDAMACAAAPDSHAFDPRVIVEDGVCKLRDRSALAGSIATTDILIKTMTKKVGMPLEDVSRLLSLTPARLMHIQDRKGSIEKGKDADFIILNEDMEIISIWHMGRKIK